MRKTNITRHNNHKKHKKRKQKTQKQRFINLSCSPKLKQKSFSCYSDEAIYQFRDLWNERHPDQKIVTTDTKEIWTRLKEYYAHVCNKESCWIRQMAKNTKLEKELLEFFSPEAPKSWKKNPNEWLSSIDIIQVMNQYEKKYSCFDFLGPSPINYNSRKLQGECVWNELCKFSLTKHMQRGHKKIGVIFNLDPDYKGGSHWVSLFINVKQKTIFFFDSTGDPIPDQIRKFVDMVIKQGTELSVPIHFAFDQNYPVEHQYGNTECGMYSIFFIIHMLEDKINGHYLKTHILKDKYMEKLRKVYFNESGHLK
jgi:hypothetical protein